MDNEHEKAKSCPNCGTYTGNDVEHHCENFTNHLSFRDQCAIAAMCALVPMAHQIAKEDGYTDLQKVSYLSNDAFDIADAMEAERIKRAKV